MDAERWARVREVLHGALEQPADRRSQFLNQTCKDDPDLREEVEGLIAASEETAWLEGAALPDLGPAAELRTDDRIGNYRVVERIGEGGMGAVYKAVDNRLGRVVALKVILGLGGSAEEKRRFFREARAASALNHPNIVTIYEYGSDGGSDFIAMEYVEGATLHEALAGGKAPLRTLLGYALQAASAVAKAHGSGIVHRDLKPKNIMITPDGVVKVLDFGLAKRLNETAGSRDGTTTELTRPGAIAGTPSYMSPEQAKGEPADLRSDIFSFGILLYEIACGKPPFQGPDIPATLYEVTHKDPPAPDKSNPAIPKELASIVSRCLKKRKEDRPQSMAEVQAEVSAAIEALPAGAPRSRPGYGRRAAAASVVLCAAGLGMWQWLRPKTGLELSLIAQKMSGGAPVGEPYAASVNDTFEAGWRFRIQAALPGPGHLYVVSDPAAGDELWILHPAPGSSGASERVLTGWYVFDENPGTERVWIVWAEAPVAPVEAALRGSARGQVKDSVQASAVRELLRTLPEGVSASLLELRHR